MRYGMMVNFCDSGVVEWMWLWLIVIYDINWM